jgi:hypothetical protein
MCSAKCHKTSCPFAYTDESEQIQNYGCLPTPLEIINMRVTHNRTWACHSDTTKPCIGAIRRLKELRLPHSVTLPLVTEDDDWKFEINDGLANIVHARDMERIKRNII